MKFARPIFIGCLAFAITLTVLALAYVTTTQLFSPILAASANPTPAVSISTEITAQSTGKVSPTAAPTPTDVPPAPTDTPLPTDTPTPTELPPVAPPTPPATSSAAFRQGMLLRTDGDFAHAAESFHAVLNAQPDPALARQAQFRLGETLWLAGKYDDAARELSELIRVDGKDGLALRAHYFLAQALTAQKKYPAALDHLRVYRSQTKSLAGEIDAEIADVMLAMGDNGGAMKQYQSALADPTLTNAQRVLFLSALADAYKALGSMQQAADKLQQAFALAPDAETAATVEYKWGLVLDAAGQRALAVTHWRHAVSAYPDAEDAYNALIRLVDSQETVDDYLRGLVDFNNEAYDAAVAPLKRYVAANPGQSSAALYYLARSYRGTKDYTSAIRTFGELLQNYPKDPRAVDAAYYRAKSFEDMGNISGAVEAYNTFALGFPGDYRADDAMMTAARLLDLANRSDEARAQYQKLVATFPGSSYAATALFNVGLDYYFNKDNANAQAVWQDLAKRYPNTTDADHALFWLGKLAHANGDDSAAQQFYKEAARPPRSYYSYRSRDLIDPFSNKPSFDVNQYGMNGQPTMVAEMEKWLANWTGGTPVSSSLAIAVLSDFHFKRGSELAQLDQAADARIEFRKVNARFTGDARALYALARYYADNNYFDLSIEAASRIQQLSGARDEALPRYLRELIYPTYYADLVVAYAQRYNFDPLLFFALMRQESMYNPLSRSWVGATGLTQVMPGTGQGIARDLGVTGFKTSDLLRPYISVRFGTYFFGQLYKYFSGNVIYSLAGYNAGPGNAKKWVRADVDEAVELIHLSESYVYVRTIYSQYNQYLEIYRGR